MSTDNGWPDPARPGVPLTPERDGWHWLQNRKPGTAPFPVKWVAAKGWAWSAVPYLPTEDTGRRYRYLGPCLTPEEVAAREKAAYQQGWGDREDDFIAGTERSGFIIIAPEELAAREAAAAVAMREACAKAVREHERDARGMGQHARADVYNHAAAVIAAVPTPTDALDAMLAQAEREGMEAAADICEESHALSGAQLAPCIRARAKEIKP